MIRGDRLQTLLTERGLSQSEFARRIGLTQPTIAKMISGGRGSSHLHRVARELGTTAAYLTGETDDPREGAIPLPTPSHMAEQLDLVPLEEIDLEYGMGGAFHDGPEVARVHQFPRQWLASITPTPSTSLFIARGRGDSMQPTIHNGDMLIIDRSQRAVREQDMVWAFTIGEMSMVKRLRVRGENVTILSDNATVPDDHAHPDEINVVGRVVFIGRRM